MLANVPVKFSGLVIVAAPGPSLASLADKCHGFPVIAVQDAWRLVPWADVMYGCDARWWLHHQGVPEFAGEKWSSHTNAEVNDKREVHERFGIKIVYGEDARGFSRDPKKIHYGSNSGFQAINLAILMGAETIALVGFDWRQVGGQTHFFGEHPAGFFKPNFETFAPEMDYAAKTLTGVQVYNCTPGSALHSFESRSLDDCIISQKRPAA
jgi:hypothetical protein